MHRKYLCYLSAVLLPAFVLAGQAKEANRVEQAIKQYMHSKENVEVHLSHVRVVGNFARATAASINADKDPVMVFMKKIDQRWIGVSYGTNFLPEDCQKLGLPSEICP